MANTEPTQLDRRLSIKYQYMLMDYPPKNWYGKGGTILHTMKDLDIPGDSRCIVIKVLIDIDQ